MVRRLPEIFRAPIWRRERRRFRRVLRLAAVMAAASAFGPRELQARGGGWPDLGLRDFLQNQPRSARRQAVGRLGGSGDFIRYYIGSVDWEYTVRGEHLHLQCDRLVFFLPGALKRLGGRAREEEEGPETPERAQAEPARLPFQVYADGNVRLELAALGVVLEADSLYYDHAVPLAFARNARVITTVGGVRALLSSMQERDIRGTRPYRRGEGFYRVPVILRAHTLRTRDFRRYEGLELTVSPCEFEVPHFALRAGKAVATRHEETAPATAPEAGEPRAAEGRSASGTQGTTRETPEADTEAEPAAEGRPPAPPRGAYAGEGEDALPLEGGAGEGAPAPNTYCIVDLDQVELEVLGHAVFPLPSFQWDTRWNDFFPIRSVDFGRSSKFGFFGAVDWNLNFFLESLPLDEVPSRAALLRKSRLSFETAYFSKRGFGYGPHGEYGTRPRRWLPWQLQQSRWNYYGEGRYFRIRDHGEDRVTGRPPDRENRSWGSVLHRQSVPYLGTVDVEFSSLSDDTFLREFFEAVAKEDKDQESLLSLRRNFRDNLAVTGLFKYRENDFETVTERLPEAKVRLLQEPVFDTGFYTDLVAQAANLRRRPREGSKLEARRFGRADLLSEWAYPTGYEPYVQARPFAFARLTGYEEVLDPQAGSEDRLAFGAGVSVSQEWSGYLSFEPESFWRRFLGVESLKHVIVPKVTYLNVFSNDLAPDETLGLDEVDTVGLEESVELSLRQAFWARIPSGSRRKVRPLLGERNVVLERVDYRTRAVLESEVSLRFFPRADRDNQGDLTSELILDNTFSPLEHLRLRAWAALNPNEDFRPERIDASVWADLVPGALSVTVGDRLSRKGAASTLTRNFVYGLVTVYLGEKWRAQAFYSRDVATGRDSEISVALARVFHRFALVLEYSLDVGEDRNHTFSLNLAPLDLVGAMLAGPQRRW